MESEVNVLIVDDTPQNLVALEALLSASDRRILKASSGVEALKHLLEHDVGVVLLDVQMGELNGYDTAALIRQRARTRGVPIIFLTAFQQDEADVAKGYAVGGTDYVFMPAEPALLRSKVDFFVERAKRAASLKGMNQAWVPDPTDLVGVDNPVLAARLLVVDDDQAALDGISQAIMLRLKGATVDAVPSAREALDRIRTTDYDAILTDIKMPGMDGLAFMAKTKELAPHIPTLLMTGHAEMTLGVKALEGGAYAFIEKPVDRDLLIAWLKRAIQLRHLTRQVEEQNRALKLWTENLEGLVEERTAALRDSERRLSYALDATVDGIYDWNVQTGHVFYSRQWVESLGYTPEEVPPDVSFWEKVLHPDDLPRVREVLQAHLEGRTPFYEMEARYRLKNGHYRWTLDRGRVVERDENGQAVRMVGSDEDITERKRTEEAVSRLAAIVTSSHDAIISTDLQGIITTWNKAAEQLYGYAAEEVLGKLNALLFPPERLVQEERILDRIRRGDRIDHYETVRRRKDGRDITVSLTASPITDAMGRVIGASKIARDVTEETRAREQLRIVTEAMAAAVTWCSRDLRYLWASKAYAAFIGRSPEEIIGQPIQQIIGDEAFQALLPYSQRVLSGEQVRYEETVTYPTVGRRRIQAIYTPTRGSQGEVDGWVAVVMALSDGTAPSS